MSGVALILAMGGALWGTTPSTTAPDPAALLERFECHRCHEGTGLSAVSEDKHCVRCHQAILDGRFEAPPETLAAWRANLRSLPAVPSLAGLGRVLRREWVETFLAAPVDLRPHLPATMPRLSLSKQEAAALARHLVPTDEPGASPDPSLEEEGRLAYRRLGCAGCHAFSGSQEAAEAGAAGSAGRVLAPDLRFARQRMRPGALVPWLLEPGRLRPETLMPKLTASEREARALAAFIWYTPLAETPPASAPTRLPPLERKVSFAEVERRVFRKVCWHCHSSPDFNRGDGGPGNTGGFGFAGRRLDLSSYEGVAAGLLGEDGQRRSAFAPTADGVPLLLAALLARQAEEAGGVIPGVRGMPLGLPSMSAEEIQLVESWIAQGRPR